MFFLFIALAVFVFFALAIGWGISWLFKPSNIQIPADLGTIKKLDEADLNKNKSLFFGAGLLLSMVATLLTIESFSREIGKIEEVLKTEYVEEEILDIPITDIPPPPPPKVIIAPIINVVKEQPKEEINIKLDPEDDEPVEEEYDVPDFTPKEEVVERILDPSEVAKLPEFPGGMDAFYDFISKNFVVSSRDAAEENKGTIYVQFVIDRSGAVSMVSVMRGVSDGLDKEAIRVMAKSPKWYPGRDHNGAPVKMRYQVPIKIK